MHWSRIEDVLDQTGDLSGKVVVTCAAWASTSRKLLWPQAIIYIFDSLEPGVSMTLTGNGSAAATNQEIEISPAVGLHNMVVVKP